MKTFRSCETGRFNTGTGGCPFVPEKIKAAILMTAGTTFDIATFEDDFVRLIHANRPDRIYPFGNIIQYAANGGDANVSSVGYGPSKFNGYNPLTETWTIDGRPMSLFKNLMRLKNIPMDVAYIDNDGNIYCEDAGNGKFKGYSLSSVYPDGAQFPTESENASMNVNLVYRDIEAAWKNSIVLSSDGNIVDKANGLQWVELVKAGGANEYKLISKDDGLDITAIYGSMLRNQTAWQNVSAAAFDPDTETFTLTTTAGESPLLKRPSDLCTFNPSITGIEQWTGQ